MRTGALLQVAVLRYHQKIAHHDHAHTGFALLTSLVVDQCFVLLAASMSHLTWSQKYSLWNHSFMQATTSRYNTRPHCPPGCETLKRQCCQLATT